MKKIRKNIRRKLTDDYIKNLEPPLVKFQTIYDTINLKLLNYKSGGKISGRITEAKNLIVLTIQSLDSCLLRMFVRQRLKIT